MMEMPDVIYAIKDITSGFDGVWDDYQWSDQSGTEYHHSRIVEDLRRENEELKAKLYKAKDALGQISRMATLPDHSSNTMTLFAAHSIARTTLEEIE